MKLEKLLKYEFAQNFVDTKLSEDQFLAKLIEHIKEDNKLENKLETLDIGIRDGERES